MAKGKYKISKRYIKAIDKKIKEPTPIPQWLKEIQKEREKYDTDGTNNY